MQSNKITLSLLLSLSTTSYAGSKPSSPVNPGCSLFPPPLRMLDTVNTPTKETELKVDIPDELLHSPTSSNNMGEIPSHAEHVRIQEILEPYPRLESLTQGVEIEIFLGMSTENIKKLIDAAFSVYPNKQGLDINIFKLLFNTLKVISMRGDDIFTRALALIPCAKKDEERLRLYGLMEVSMDVMDNEEYAERLFFAEKHAHKSSQCFYFFAINVMSRPIDEVRKKL